MKGKRKKLRMLGFDDGDSDSDNEQALFGKFKSDILCEERKHE